MPLQDLLGEVQTLSQLQHQRFADALTAQVQQSNMDIAHATMILTLPTPGARAAFNKQDWSGLAAILPQSTDTIRELALGDAVKQHGFDPQALHEGLTRLVSGEGQGDVAKSDLQAQAINAVPSTFSQDLPALFRSVVTNQFTGQGAAGFAADQAIAHDPKMYTKMAGVQSGTDVSASTKLGSDTALATNSASVGANIYGTQAQERIAMMAQGTELARMSMEERMRQFAAKGAMSDKSVEFLKLAQHAYDNLNAGGLNGVGQLGNQQLYNTNVAKLVEAGSLSPDALKYQDEGGMLLRTGSIGGENKVGIALKKAFGIGKQ